MVLIVVECTCDEKYHLILFLAFSKNCMHDSSVFIPVMSRASQAPVKRSSNMGGPTSWVLRAHTTWEQMPSALSFQLNSQPAGPLAACHSPVVFICTSCLSLLHLPNKGEMPRANKKKKRICGKLNEIISNCNYSWSYYNFDHSNCSFCQKYNYWYSTKPIKCFK